MIRMMLFVIFSLCLISCDVDRGKEDLQMKMLENISSTIKQQTPVYELYPTRNMWNFIKLDTRNGKMWLVQFTVEDDNNRFQTVLSDKSLVLDGGDEKTPGRFKLHETQNMYNYVLIDQSLGQTYQVQWSFEPENRFVVPII